MKKLLSLSLMLSLGLATVTPALNAAQSQTIAQSQKNPADASGWQAAKKWWRSGRKMSALNPQEQQAFKSLMKKFAITAIIAAIVAMIGGSVKYRQHRSEQEKKAQERARHLGRELISAARTGNQPKVEELLAKGADVNAAGSYGWTALIWAADKGHENIVRRLLQVKGINVNAVTHQGDTAFRRAAMWDYKNIMKMLSWH